MYSVVFPICILCHKCRLGYDIYYPLVNVYITMDNHHVING